MKILKLLEIKNAVLHDHRFRELFPELQEEFTAVINNPGCACNMPVFRKVLLYKDRLAKYFPTREIQSTDKELEQVSRNSWSVINCDITTLEDELSKLHKHGRKQLAVARWEDKVTVVVNDLDIVF